MKLDTNNVRLIKTFFRKIYQTDLADLDGFKVTFHGKFPKHCDKVLN